MQFHGSGDWVPWTLHLQNMRGKLNSTNPITIKPSKKPVRSNRMNRLSHLIGCAKTQTAIWDLLAGMPVAGMHVRDVDQRPLVLSSMKPAVRMEPMSRTIVEITSQKTGVKVLTPNSSSESRLSDYIVYPHYTWRAGKKKMTKLRTNGEQAERTACFSDERHML